MLRYMEVADADGRHIGIVDSVDGDWIRLVDADPTDGPAYRLRFDAVDHITNTCLYLKRGTPPTQRMDMTDLPLGERGGCSPGRNGARPG